jgi:hypothetical protein
VCYTVRYDYDALFTLIHTAAWRNAVLNTVADNAVFEHSVPNSVRNTKPMLLRANSRMHIILVQESDPTRLIHAP